MDSMRAVDDRVLALGDSYTIGEGVAEHERWPVQLVSRLRARGVAVAWPRIIARTGWTTDELAAAMDEARFEPPYALVTLLVGVNNQYRGRGLDEYRARFHSLLTRAIELAGADPRRVIVVSIPDWGVTPFAHNEHRDPAQTTEQIDTFNAAARMDADAHGAHFVDITALSRDPRHRHLLVADGLHPSGAQYARWVDAIAPVAVEILET